MGKIKDEQQFCHADGLFFLWGGGMGKAPDTAHQLGCRPGNSRLVDSDHISPETRVRAGIVSLFGIMGFSTSDAIWGLPFSL